MSDLTPKQESFAQKFIELGNATEAYRQSYNASKMSPETVNRSAKELLDHPKISARIEALRESLIKRHNVTIDSILAELEEARQVALKAPTPQSSAAVAASMGKAKIAGIEAELGSAANPIHNNLNIKVSFG